MSSSNSIEIQSDGDALNAAVNEINALKNTLLEKQNQLIAMESACLRESDRQVELEDSVIAWQDKYDRLYESHKRVQKVNQNLEDKLLKLVDRNDSERAQLNSDVATMSVRLAQANFNIAKLQREIERYKADINLAIQLLQCKPDNFMQQKVSSLPIDIQSKVSSYVRLESNSHSDSETSTNGATTTSYKVLPASDSPPPAPCPFPPTAMVYSMRGIDAKNNINESINNTKNNANENQSANNNKTKLNNINITNSSSSISNSTSSLLNTNNHHMDTSMISPIVIAKFLEDELKADKVKHCDTCNCTKQDLTVLATDFTRLYTVATQTPYQGNRLDGGGGGGGSGNGSGNMNESQTQLCLRCHSNLNSPSRANSPYMMKLIKSSDSVISETKSSVSDLNDMDKLFTPSKKDDLMVNPILGHHRLCDRTATNITVTPTSNVNVQNQSGVGKLATSTIIYPTTHLGAYAAEKYLLETNSMTAQNCNQLRSNIPNASYKRRFLDGGGTALDLLDKYEKQNKPSEDCNGNNELDDEAKPLLSATSPTNLQTTKDLIARSSDICEVAEVACEEVNSTADIISNSNDNRDRDDNGNNIKSSLKKCPINSSMSSVWSKTSSGDGVKIFENFNRNLIKTIKAENPKYRGPRLCAMRIQQNGQSNILLDNIESIEAVTPVIYKRRERLLDEELDDIKDVITSNTTAAQTMLTIQNPITKNEIPTTTVHSSECKDVTSALSEEILETNAESNNCKVPDEEIVCNGNLLMIQETIDNKTVHINHSDENAILNHNTDAIDVIPPTLPEKQQLQNDDKLSQNYEILNNLSSSKASINSKSCTQSSSISDTIDFQENVMLRRQQLSRVAEWVQSNRQQLEEQQQKLIDSGLSHCVDPSNLNDRQSSFSTLEQELVDSVASIEKQSTDSGYKTTPQTQGIGFMHNPNIPPKNSSSPKKDSNCNYSNNNNTNNNIQSQQMLKTFYRRTTRSGLPVPCTFNGVQTTANVTDMENVYTGYHSQAGSSSSTTTTNTNGTPILPEPPTCDILNYKYYPSENDKTHAIHAELHTTTQNVDIAQMEYNVKQFLLKQNEWSMRCSTTVGMDNNANNFRTNNINHTKLLTTTNNQFCTGNVYRVHSSGNKILRQVKIFSNGSGGGFGPGVGARVTATTTTKTTTRATNTMDKPMPQRTETNL